MHRFFAWARTQPDRPFVILFAHCLVVLLYVTGHAVSTVPFSGAKTQAVIDSPLPPITHAIAAVLLVVAIASGRFLGIAAGVSVMVWASNTAALFFLSHERIPPLAYWGFALSAVITLAAFLMFVRWGVDGDDRGRQ